MNHCYLLVETSWDENEGNNRQITPLYNKSENVISAFKKRVIDTLNIYLEPDDSKFTIDSLNKEFIDLQINFGDYLVKITKNKEIDKLNFYFEGYHNQNKNDLSYYINIEALKLPICDVFMEEDLKGLDKDFNVCLR